MIDEEENNEIRKMLKNLPAVKGSDDFLDKLNTRITRIETEKNSLKPIPYEIDNEGIFERISRSIRNAWLVPALGLSAAVIFVFYITFMNKDEIINEQKIENNKTEKKLEPENTTGNTSSTEVSPSAIPDNSGKKTDLNIQPEKDITGNSDNKEDDKLPAKVEQNNNNTDQDESVTEKRKLNVAVPEGIVKDKENKLTEEKSDDNHDESNKMGKSPTSSNEKKMNKDKSMKTTSEKMEEFEKPIQKSILDKLDALNKTNLESLREKVNK